MNRSLLLYIGLFVGLGCSESGPGPDQPWPQVCPTDSHALGPACVQTLQSEQQFDQISLADSREFAERVTKYMVPVARDLELLPPQLQNAKRYERHLDFLKLVFPDRFPGLGPKEYEQMIFLRASRKYFSGNFYRLKHTGSTPRYGFDISTAVAETDLAALHEVQQTHRFLRELLGEGRELAYVVHSSAGGVGAVERAKSWIEPGFPIVFLKSGGELKTEVYTPGITYGRLRLFTLEQFNQAAQQGQVGWQDIVVIDQVPFDIESVVAGVVTGARQWLLSHVNVRMARRGTPNVYLRTPLTGLKSLEGKLVKMEAVKAGAGEEDHVSFDDSVTVTEAEAHWAAHRPKLSNVPVADGSYVALPRLLEMDPTLDWVPRVGGKAANLAQLYHLINLRYQVPGFAIPFAYFEAFMQQNTLLDPDTGESISYREYARRLSEDPRVRTDALFRRQRLDAFRQLMEAQGKVDPKLVQTLAARIKQVFAHPMIKVRFRSSSNVEDALEFSGAGLYSSTSVCALDTLDGDTAGPSHCDANKSSERTIERGLRRVWSSLYNARAWDEREWYQVPQARASMAILVTRAFGNELANGVAFTGNPTSAADGRYLINAQIGDESVVSNDPQVVPEKDLLTLTAGKVTAITRSRPSSLLSAGAVVLDDAQLTELGELMARVEASYPLTLGTIPRDRVLLDLEFKLDALDGLLKLKQIRPFLLPE